MVAVKNVFRSLRSRTYLLLSRFQNDGATVECSTLCTSPDPVSSSMLSELKRGGRKGIRKGYMQVLVETNVCGGPHRSIGRSLMLTPALNHICTLSPSLVEIHRKMTTFMLFQPRQPLFRSVRASCKTD